MRKVSSVLLLAGILLLSFTQSCTKQEAAIAPQLPPQESFVMEFNGFEDTDTTKSFTNWFYAATNVAYWNIVINVGLAVPVASFKEAFNHEAIFQGNQTWKWVYSVTVDGITYTAELFGKILSAEEVQWDMYVSQQNGFTDFHWYTGVVKTDHSAAHWILFKNIANTPVDMVDINYVKDVTAGTAQITYTNIEPNSLENGGYISYGTQNEYYNANYDIYHTGQDNLTEIEANTSNNEGRVKDPNQFGDEEWHCWNHIRRNIVCE